MADPYEEEDLPQMFDPLEVKCSECKEDLTLDTRLLVDGKVLCVQCTEKAISRDDPGYMSDCNETALRALLHRLRFIQQSGDESLLLETNIRFNKLLGDCYHEICAEHVDFEDKTDLVLDETGSRIPRSLLLELAESVELTESKDVSTIRAQLVGGIVKCYLVKYLKYLESQRRLDPIYRDSEDIAWMHFKSEEYVADINEDPLFLLRDTGYEDLVKILDLTQNLEQKLKIQLAEEKEVLDDDEINEWIDEAVEARRNVDMGGPYDEKEEEGKDSEQVEEMIDYYGILIRRQDLASLELLREEWYADDTVSFVEDMEIMRGRGEPLGEWARRSRLRQAELAEWDAKQADEEENLEEEEELDEWVEAVRNDPMYRNDPDGFREDYERLQQQWEELGMGIQERIRTLRNLIEEEELNMEEGKDGEQVEEMIDYYGITIRRQDLAPLELLREEWYADDTDRFIEDLEIMRRRGESLSEWCVEQPRLRQAELAEWDAEQADEEELDDDSSVASTISYDEYDRREREGDFDQLGIDPVEDS